MHSAVEIRVGRDMLIVDEEESADSPPPREIRIARALIDALRRRSRLLGALVAIAVAATAALIPRDGTHASVDAATTSAVPAPAVAILERIVPSNPAPALGASLDPAVVPPPTPIALPSIRAGCRGFTPSTRGPTGIAASTDGQYGIDGSTVLSASNPNDAFILVRRGTSLGDRISVELVQASTSAPATWWVSYTVSASAHRTAWGTLAFELGVKPIAFAESCWRIIADGVDTGLVIAVGR